MTKDQDLIVYHITPHDQWEIALQQGEYQPGSLASEGFIHLSTHQQVPATLTRFFAGQTGLVLLCVEVSRLKAELRYEAADGQFFPHLYGPLNLDAVVEIRKIQPDSDDLFSDLEG